MYFYTNILECVRMRIRFNDFILIRLPFNCNWGLCEHKHLSWANTYIVVQMLDKNTARMTNKHSANIIAFAKSIFPSILLMFSACVCSFISIFFSLFLSRFLFLFFLLTFCWQCVVHREKIVLNISLAWHLVELLCYAIKLPSLITIGHE